MSAMHAAEHQPTERWSVLGGVLLSALYLWVLAWLLLAVLVPAVGLGWQPVVITSGSMEPLIRPGDVVLSSTADVLEPGTVVTYEDPARDGALTTHRIVQVTDDGDLRTQGDANLRPDSTTIPRENVVGRGRLLVPLIGLPLVWMSGGAILFGLWVLITAVTVAVVVGTGTEPTPVSTSPGVRGLAGAARPRRVQRRLVRGLARSARRLHDAVYRGHRPNPGRLRRVLPSLLVVATTAALARSAAGLAVGAVVLALVLLFDPDGPQLRIGRWQRLGRDVVDVAAATLPTGAGRGLVVAVVLVAVAGSVAGRSAATFSAAASTTGSSFTAATQFPFDGLVLWLQNDPEGQDTADQPFRALRADEPTQTTLPNYDTDRDGVPGLRLQNGGVDQYETDPDKIKRWTYAPGGDLTLADVTIVFHSAVKDHALAESATVAWFLRHCVPGGTDCVEIGSASLSSDDWQGPTPGFTEREVTIAGLSHVVPAGRVLEVAVTEPAGAKDLWLAYDTVDHPSRVEITTAAAGTCPGTGSTTQPVVADARVEEDKPLDNFSGNGELDVQAKPDADQRTLLQVALPTVPDGCTLTAATLHLETRTSELGRTVLAQRLDAPFDATTVTWATQPTASGPTGAGASTPNGPAAFDVLAPVEQLYALGNTGLVLRDAGEGDGLDSENRFHSIDSRPWPDPEAPRLEITWGP